MKTPGGPAEFDVCIWKNNTIKIEFKREIRWFCIDVKTAKKMAQDLYAFAKAIEEQEALKT